MKTDFQTIGQIAAEQARRQAYGEPPLTEIRWNTALAMQMAGFASLDEPPAAILGIPVKAGDA